MLTLPRERSQSVLYSVSQHVNHATLDLLIKPVPIVEQVNTRMKGWLPSMIGTENLTPDFRYVSPPSIDYD